MLRATSKARLSVLAPGSTRHVGPRSPAAAAAYADQSTPTKRTRKNQLHVPWISVEVRLFLCCASSHSGCMVDGGNDQMQDQLGTRCLPEYIICLMQELWQLPSSIQYQVWPPLVL